MLNGRIFFEQHRGDYVHPPVGALRGEDRGHQQFPGIAMRERASHARIHLVKAGDDRPYALGRDRVVARFGCRRRLRTLLRGCARPTWSRRLLKQCARCFSYTFLASTATRLSRHVSACHGFSWDRSPVMVAKRRCPRPKVTSRQLTAAPRDEYSELKGHYRGSEEYSDRTGVASGPERTGLPCHKGLQRSLHPVRSAATRRGDRARRAHRAREGDEVRRRHLATRLQ